jgi:proteasome lid subunit RPN8/RPN11
MSMDDGPKPGVTRFSIAESVRVSTQRFLRQQGLDGSEAIAVWLGYLEGDGEASIQRAYVPEQVPLRSDGGVGVYVDGEAITRLILALDEDERVLARVHSHPGFAYHSDTDDLNRLISHAGAISIVVPYFASHGLRLEICSVNELVPGEGWKELSADDVSGRFRVV